MHYMHKGHLRGKMSHILFFRRMFLHGNKTLFYIDVVGIFFRGGVNLDPQKC